MVEFKIPYVRDVTPANLFALLTILVLLVILITKFFILNDILVINPPTGILP